MGKLLLVLVLLMMGCAMGCAMTHEETEDAPSCSEQSCAAYGDCHEPPSQCRNSDPGALLICEPASDDDCAQSDKCGSDGLCCMHTDSYGCSQCSTC
jgi:hypothetical protein